MQRCGISWLLLIALVPIAAGQETTEYSYEIVSRKAKEELRFGMDITVDQGRVTVSSIQEGRPIALKLKPGDILFQFQTLNSGLGRKDILGFEDIARIKELLSEGNSVELTVHRPGANGALAELRIVLVADDLHTISRVQTETRTVMVPYTSSVEVDAVGTMDSKGIFRMPVYYGTNRKLEGGIYTGEREQQVLCKYGVCQVTIPPKHISGTIERPRWLRLEFREDPEKHIVLASVSQIGRPAVLDSMRLQFAEIDEDRKRVLIFVHGYNTAFDDAARRAAQLAFDTGFKGLASFFSWPSNGTTRAYPSDEADNAFSLPALSEFLATIEGSRDVEDIYVVAHSMGCRVTTRALLDLKRRGKGGKIREFVLAAPDIDAGVFQNQYADELVRGYSRVTVYASSEDRALWASGSLHGSSRLGAIVNGRPTIQARDRLDIIDASVVRTSFLEHSNFGDSKSILNDIFHLFREATLRPNQRTPSILQVNGPGFPHFRYRP